MSSQPPAASSTRRGAWLEIDLDAILANVEVVRSVVGPAVRVAPVIKADAYGHGLGPVAAALAGRVEALSVATLDEGLALRAQGVGGRVLLLYPVPPDAVEEAVRARLEPTVMSDRDAKAVVTAAARSTDRPAGTTPDVVGVQLAVESGMHRGGIVPHEIVAIARRLATAPAITIAGTWTHHCCPEDAATATAQDGRFRAALESLDRAGIAPGERHAASSGGLFAATVPSYDLVRPGLAIYGLLGDGLPLTPATAGAAARLRPALALKARAVALGDVPNGSSVGYGASWRAERPSRIATLPIGYGDGYARSTRPGAAIVRGRRVPVVGLISMDAIALDVTDVDGLGYDDVFVLLGEQDGARIDASDLARARNTIAWEVLSSMAARLGRVYHRSTAAG